MKTFLKILLLEDLKEDAEITEYVLKKNGLNFELKMVSDRESFTSELQKLRPDIILADYSLPSWTGIEALKYIRERGIDIPFILVTGTQTDENAVECIKEGADDYILKKAIWKLPASIEKAVDNRRIRKENELIREELRKSEEHYRLITENANDLIAVLDIEGNYLYVSPSYKELGYSPSALIGKNSYEYIHEDDKETVKIAWRSALSSLKNRKVEYRFREKNGKWLFMETSGKWIFDGEGRAQKTVIVSRDNTQRKENEIQLKITTDKLRTLTAHLQTALEEERTRISREIHDELGQLMTALKMDLSLLNKRLSQLKDASEIPMFLDEIKKISGLADMNIQAIRKIATELRPDFLDNLGLPAAMQWQLEEFQRRTGINCFLKIENEDLDADEERITALFRVFQEAMTNIARHSDAKNARINLKEENNLIILEIEDDGKGGIPSGSPDIKSLGILGMKERMMKFGGDVKVSNIGVKGTRVMAILPILTIG